MKNFVDNVTESGLGRVAELKLEPEPAFFGSSGDGAVNFLRLRLRTKLKNSFLNGGKYVKVSKSIQKVSICRKYVESRYLGTYLSKK